MLEKGEGRGSLAGGWCRSEQVRPCPGRYQRWIDAARTLWGLEVQRPSLPSRWYRRAAYAIASPRARYDSAFFHAVIVVGHPLADGWNVSGQRSAGAFPPAYYGVSAVESPDDVAGARRASVEDVDFGWNVARACAGVRWGIMGRAVCRWHARRSL